MSAVDTQFYKKKKQTSLLLAIIFLFFVIGLSFGLYFYEKRIKNENREIRESISKLDSWIQAVQQDKLVEVYRNYEKHKKVLEMLSSRSQIPTLVLHLKKNFAKYGIDARGFNYNEGVVSTNLSAQTNETGYAYEKIVKFLREYPQDPNARFKIQPISSFTWYDRINYSLDFVLK